MTARAFQYIWIQIFRMPFFSVIIPSYNKERYVATAIESILSQTFTDFEIIIVDDASSDESIRVVTPYLSENVRLLKHVQNKGLSAARNTGIKDAQGKMVALLDADDSWHPSYLQKIYDLTQKFPEVSLFATNYYEVYPTGKKMLPAHRFSGSSDDIMIADFFSVSLAQPIYCSCSFSFKKSVASSIGYYDESITFAEDIDFNIRANLRFQLAYSPQALVNYNMVSADQITHSPLTGRQLPNLDKYEQAEESESLRRYIDFNRYIFARHYKLEGNTRACRQMSSGINPKNLSLSQRILLSAPLWLIRLLGGIKERLRKSGIRVNTYANDQTST